MKTIYFFILILISVFGASLSFASIMNGDHIFGMFMLLLSLLCIISNSINFYKSL